MKITILSNFGTPARGVSPYSDLLVESISLLGLEVNAVDYKEAYPHWLSPSVIPRGGVSDPKYLVHYLKPSTWIKFCEQADEVVHIQYWTQFGAYYLYYICNRLAKLGKKTVITIHNPEPHESLPVFGWYEKKMISAANRIIVHTQGGLDLLKGSNSDWSEKTVVIPHGVRMQTQASGSAKLREKSSGANAPYILMFGNIRKYKGTDILLKAWAKIANHYPDYSLVIAGRLWGQEGGLLKRLANTLLGGRNYARNIAQLLESGASNRVSAKLGFVADQELDCLIESATLAIFPYQKFAGQSGAAALAAGAGIPIVVSDIEGLIELAIDKTYVASPLSIDSLASVISDKLSNMDSQARSRQIEKARASSWPVVASKHMQVYESLLSSQ
ncbi:MAG: glycosyltransferase [Halioglobus sp.]